MGYRIDYGTVKCTPEPVRKGSGRLRVMIAMMLLAFSLTVRLTWQEGAVVLQKILLPGELTVAQQAFSELVYDLRKGQNFTDALTGFCYMIFNETS